MEQIGHYGTNIDVPHPLVVQFTRVESKMNRSGHLVPPGRVEFVDRDDAYGRSAALSSRRSPVGMRWGRSPEATTAAVIGRRMARSSSSSSPESPR